MSEFTPTDRTQVHRMSKRGNYDREVVYKILDEALICHVGFVVHAQPYVIPTGFGRLGDILYLHGSAASRMLGEIGTGTPVCVTVTLLDGLVLARSAFHHSMNYRSVVILGTAQPVISDDQKRIALSTFTNHVVPGRWDDVRQPAPQELKATSVLALPLEEVSAKIRTGPPIDDDADYSLSVWAGVVPLKMTAGAPQTDPRLSIAIDPPAYARDYHR